MAQGLEVEAGGALVLQLVRVGGSATIVAPERGERFCGGGMQRCMGAALPTNPESVKQRVLS